MIKGRATVLLVENQPDTVQTLASCLTTQGFDVSTACSCSVALEMCRTHVFDVALLDLMMPGIDGVETLEALKAADKNLEVVVGTGIASADCACACLQHGAYDYIEKPYNLAHLGAMLHRAGERSRRRALLS